MENKNICYIDYMDSYLDIFSERFPKLLRKIIYFFLNYIGYIKRNENILILFCVENDIVNFRMLERLINIIKEKDYEAIVLAEKLFKNDILVNILKENNINILNGYTLNKFLALDVLEKIAYIQNRKLNNIEVSILTNNDSDFHIENIKLIAPKCKILNVVTNKLRQFQVVEKYVFDEFGNIINVSRNKSKACLRSDIVLNFDYNIDMLEKCNFNKNTILVQFTGEEFDSRIKKVIMNYKLKFPSKYLKVFEKLKHFDENIIYESFLYRKNSFENTRKILKNDNIYIKYFVGIYGKINFKDIKI